MRRTLSHETQNALSNIDTILPALATKVVVVLLDYDGTLTPIVKDPMAAVLPASTKALLKDLSSLFVTGVVSGRSLDKLQHFVGLENDVFFAGSHGFDITGPGPPPCGPAGPETDELNSGSGDVKYPEESNNSRPSSPSSPSSLGLLRGASSPPGSPISMRHQVAVEFLPRLQLVKQELEAKLADVAGASVEDNRFSLSVHYRNVETDSGRQAVETAVADVLDKESSWLKAGRGKMVLELKPNVAWDKGSSVLWLLEALGLKDRGDVFALYIGDDTTDEDAFRVMQARGLQHGMGIRVFPDPHQAAEGEREVRTNQESEARQALRDPAEVAAFLTKLVAFGRAQQHAKEEEDRAAATAAAAAAAATAADAAGAPSSPLPSSRDDTEMATTPSDESAASAAAAAANAAAAAANASAAAAAAAAVAVAAFSPEPSTGSPAREGDVIMRTRQPDVQAVDT